MPRQESNIQSDFLVDANAAGWLAFKAVNESKRGGPDTLCSRLRKRRSRHELIAIWIEFKKPGAPPPTKQQEKRHEELKACGYHVFWSDSVEHAMQLLADVWTYG